MTTRARVALGAIFAFVLGGAALAAQQGVTSGPAAGKNITPSTAIQKEYEGRSVVGGEVTMGVLEASGLAAGLPGVEGKPGTQSGQEAPKRKAPRTH